MCLLFLFNPSLLSENIVFLLSIVTSAYCTVLQFCFCIYEIPRCKVHKPTVFEKNNENLRKFFFLYNVRGLLFIRAEVKLFRMLT
jgi:hypothetical protein